MIYQTKKKKTNEYIQKAIKSLQTEGKEAVKKDFFIATICIDLGVAEAEVVEALGLFEKASILKVTEKEVVLY